MEDKMEQLVRSLKEAKPVLKNPESLTDSIMEQIGKRTEQRVAPLMLWARAVLSSAAILLLGLFIFQQTEAENSTTTASVKPFIENKLVMDSTCMQLHGSEHLSYIKTYLCYLQQNSIENELNKSYPLQKN